MRTIENGQGSSDASCSSLGGHWADFLRSFSHIRTLRGTHPRSWTHQTLVALAAMPSHRIYSDLAVWISTRIENRTGYRTFRRQDQTVPNFGASTLSDPVRSGPYKVLNCLTGERAARTHCYRAAPRLPNYYAARSRALEPSAIPTRASYSDNP